MRAFSRLAVAWALLCAAALTAAWPAPAHAREVVVTFGGDVCGNRSRLAPEPNGTRFGPSLVPWSEWTRHIGPLIDGHINFLNLETVLSDKPLSSVGKKYAFLTHPNALRHLVGLGFNLLSLANNHAFDYGVAGARATYRHVQAIAAEGKREVHFAGLGLNEKEAGAVQVFRVRGHRVAFASMGNLTNMNLAHRAGPTRPGTLGVRIDEDYERVLENLRRVEADYKIFSVHLGVERRVQLDAGQRAKYERALAHAGVDLLIGHHPHVVRPVQKKGPALIFYSMGNFMIRGARDMWPLPDAQDYGLFGRIFLSFDVKTARLVPTAVEVLPLTEMHAIARPLRGAEGQRRVRVLNRLSADELGDEAVQFHVRNDGSGVVCFGGEYGPRASRVCGQRYRAPKTATRPAAARPPSDVRAKPPSKVRAKPVRKVRAKPVRKVRAKPPSKVRAKPARKVRAKPARKVRAKPARRVRAKPPGKVRARAHVKDGGASKRKNERKSKK